MKSKLFILSVVIGVLLPVTTAYAAPAPQYWAIGNGHIIADILNATKLLMQESGYLQLLYIIALVGFIVVATTASISSAVKPEAVIAHFIVILLVLTVIFRAGMNITVHDPVNNYTEIVTDVPLVVGLPATFISAVGNFLLTGVETFFSYPGSFGSTPSEISLRESGQFNIQAQLLLAGTQVRFVDPNIRASMYAYTKDCVVPWLYRGIVTVDQIRESRNLWQTLKVDAAAMLTMRYDDTHDRGYVLSCIDAWTQLRADFTAKAPQLVGAGFSAFQHTNATAYFAGAYSQMRTFMTGGTGGMTTAQMMRHNAIINTFGDSSQRVISSMGGNKSVVYAINTAQAKAAQKSGWAIAAEVFQTLSGYLYTVLQAFVLGIIPIAVLALLIPSYGKKMAAMVVKLMIWLALWQPLLGIANFIIAGYQRQAVGGMINSGLAIENMNAITLATQNSALAASFFATCIPLLAWGVVSSGSFAITSFIDGSTKGHVPGAAEKTGSGSVDAENIRTNNISSNSADTTTDFRAGTTSPTLSTMAGGITMQEQAGGVIGSQAGVQSVETATMQASGTRSLSSQVLSTWSDEISSMVSGKSEMTAQEMASSIVNTLYGDKITDQQTRQEAAQLQDSLQSGISTRVEAETTAAARGQQASNSSGTLGIGGKGGMPGVSTSTSSGAEESDAARQMAKTGQSADSGSSVNSSVTFGELDGVVTTDEMQSIIGESLQGISSSGYSQGRTLAEKLVNSETVSETVSAAESYTRTEQSQSPQSLMEAEQTDATVTQNITGINEEVGADAAQMDGRGDSFRAGVGESLEQRRADVLQQYEQLEANASLQQAEVAKDIQAVKEGLASPEQIAEKIEMTQQAAELLSSDVSTWTAEKLQNMAHYAGTFSFIGDSLAQSLENAAESVINAFGGDTSMTVEDVLPSADVDALVANVANATDLLSGRISSLSSSYERMSNYGGAGQDLSFNNGEAAPAGDEALHVRIEESANNPRP